MMTKLMVVALAGWINRQQEDVGECRERLGGLPRYYYREAA